MPALVTCGKSWNIGSDDFVLPALFAVIIRLVSIGAVVGVLIYLFVGPEGCPDPPENVPPFLYGSLFALLGIELLTVIIENIIFSISSKGPIYDHIHKNKRKWLPFWLFVRVFLFFVETAVVIICTVAVFGPAPYAAGALQCPEYHDGPLVFAEAVVVTLLVVLSLYAIGFAIYLDPLGLCCAPSVLEDLGHIDEAEGEELDADLREYLSENQLGRLHRNHIGFGRIFRKVRGALCCLNAGGKRSRTTAMQEVALALHTIFSDAGRQKGQKKEDRLVPSDVVAGMILVSRNQKLKREACSQCTSNRGVSCICLTKEFRNLTLNHLPDGDKPSTYETAPPKEFNFSDPSESQLFENLVHYMHYAMGVYGWTLHIFDNLCCGLCQLCSVTCCVCNYRCVNERHGVDFHFDDMCMSGVGTVMLRSGLKEREIIYATYENEVYQAPFSICLDNAKETIVLSVRGTLSIKDALTDMSPSMKKLDDEYHVSSVEGAQYIHKGMYLTATQILADLNKTKVLDNLMDEHKDYQLVITGHSLGAGVASVLAVLLKPKDKYKDLVCYAFSPPGCVLSFPLALYSRSFTTSVVLGNDMIPRVSFRSLLYFKRQVAYLLKECKKPKAQVIYQPRWVESHIPQKLRECFCGPHTDPHMDTKEIVKDILPHCQTDGEKQAKQHTSLSAVARALKATKKWKLQLTSKDSLHHFVEGIENGEQIAAFPPGSMVHIKVTQVAKPLCLGYCYPNQLAVEHISTEDLCVIVMDRGMIDDHLPNAVLNALKRCKKQFLPNHEAAENGHQMQREAAKPLQDLEKQPSSKSPHPPMVITTLEKLYSPDTLRPFILVMCNKVLPLSGCYGFSTAIRTIYDAHRRFTKMPALVTQWNVGSDDFVLPAIMAVVARVICIGAVVGVLLYLFVGPEGCPGPPEIVPPFLYGSLFAFIAIQLLAVIVETIIFSISAKGAIYDYVHRKRRWLPFWLLIRVLLFMIETEVVIACTVAVFGPAPYAAGALQCPEYHDGPLVFAKVVVVAILVLLAIYAVGFAVFLDPLGVCHAPTIINSLKKRFEIPGENDDHRNEDCEAVQRQETGEASDANSDNTNHGRVIALGRFLKRTLCCLSAGTKRSKNTALREVALALYTIFSDEDVKKGLVPSDIVAGMILLSHVHNGKKQSSPGNEDGKRCACSECLKREFKQFKMKCLPNEYKTLSWKCEPPWPGSSKEELLNDLTHYMHYAMGVYGWKLHVFDNLCCGLCQLCTVTCCACNYRCLHERDGVDIHNDDLCMSGIGTIMLRSGVEEPDIIYANYKNEKCEVPFSVCIDDKKKNAIVLSIRGTLSLKDALTDMSAIMKPVQKEYLVESVAAKAQYIHLGMYKAAKNILEKLSKLEGSDHKGSTDLDALMNKHSQYQLVITGHSLGAGVASVLAFLLHQSKDYRDRIICYAFSPPGCVFSFPLMVYSRNFTISVILGNDMIPRVSFPSLLFLKYQLLYLLEECKKPKVQVIFQPGWVEKYIPKKLRELFCGRHTDPNINMEKITQILKKEIQPQNEKEPQNVAYAPGSILHIKIDRQETKCKLPCFGCSSPNAEISVALIDNEDLCMLEIDKGMFDDHLPNAVLNALKRCQRDNVKVSDESWRKFQLQSTPQAHLETTV